MEKNKEKQPSWSARLIKRAEDFAAYCWTGVWRDPNDNNKIRTIKVLNLSVRSFLDRDLQTRSMALTYSTVLAIVPAFALLFAIGRGFGFQNLLEKQLFAFFPAQNKFLEFAIKFVDSYLKEASQGVFVGVGLIFLLWTLISLLSYIEQAFNHIWDVKRDRSFYQKVTDYISICLLVPVLMICEAGVSIFMSASVQDNIHFAFLTPFVNIALETAPFVLAWLAFSLSFCLIPNTKVNFKYAAISGAICAIAFQVIQLLFVNGQLYVSKYNAIYGSFAFLPLLLIWLQLSWLILLFGCVLTYSLQNVLSFNFVGDLKSMSTNYVRKVLVILMAVIADRFEKQEKPLTRPQISTSYDIPIRLVTNLCEVLQQAGLVNYVMMPGDHIGMSLAVDASTLTVGDLMSRVSKVGESDFIPGFAEMYAESLSKIDSWIKTSLEAYDNHRLSEIKLPDVKITPLAMNSIVG